MRYLHIIMSTVFFSCNSYNGDKNNNKVIKDDHCFEYPSSVNKLLTKDLYDSTKWYVYTWHCDEEYKPKSDSMKSVKFGELPLNFFDCILRGDTLEISFTFMDNKQPILSSMTRDFAELCTGVGFNIKTKKKIYMLSLNGFSTTIKSGTDRYNNPLQPEVLAYIKSNWDKLNPCFRTLAEQKGIRK